MEGGVHDMLVESSATSYTSTKTSSPVSASCSVVSAAVAAVFVRHHCA